MPCSVSFSIRDDPCDVEPNSPESARDRWLHFAEHSCLACECETSPVQLQKNVFFGFFPPAVPLWQEGKVEQRGRRGNVLLYCCFLRHQEGKDKIRPAALPLPMQGCVKPQHLCCLSHRATSRGEKLLLSLSLVFTSKSMPEGESRPFTFLTATLRDHNPLLWLLCSTFCACLCHLCSSSCSQHDTNCV